MTIALTFIALLLYHARAVLRTQPHQSEHTESAEVGANPPRVSFLVPAWNARNDIGPFVEAYRSLSYPNRELIVCAGGSDGSYAVASTLAGDNVQILEQSKGEGKQRALLRSFGHATGSLIYLTDIDCRPSDAVVNNLVQYTQHHTVQVVTGESCPLDTQMQNAFVQVQWAVDQAAQPRHVTTVRGILGRNALITRAVIEETGALSVDAPSGTDYTLAQEVLRAGHYITFAPHFPMPTEYPEDLTTYMRKQARWIRNVYVLGRRYGDRNGVRGSTMTMASAYAVLLSAAFGLVRRHGFAVAGLLSMHAILNRVRYQRSAGMTSDLRAATLHFVATEGAALRASIEIARKYRAW